MAVTPSKRPRSHITDTTSPSSTSISHTSRPPFFPFTARSQPSPTDTSLVNIPNPESVDRHVTSKQPTAIKTVRLQPQLDLVQIPETDYTSLPPLQLPSESRTISKIYPRLKPLRKVSTTLSNLVDDSPEYTPSQESSGSIFIPHHRYNFRNLPTWRLSTDTSTLNFTALSSNSALRLARQHAQPQFFDTHSPEFVPQSYFTSGFGTASLLSSDAQVFFLKYWYLLMLPHILNYLNIIQQKTLDLQLLILPTIQSDPASTVLLYMIRKFFMCSKFYIWVKDYKEQWIQCEWSQRIENWICWWIWDFLWCMVVKRNYEVLNYEKWVVHYRGMMVYVVHQNLSHIPDIVKRERRIVFLIILLRVVYLWNEICNARRLCMSNVVYQGVNVFYLIIFGFFVCDGNSMYPICPVGSVATWFVEFCIIVAQVFSLSPVKTSIKLNVVLSLVEKEVCGTVGRIGFVV